MCGLCSVQLKNGKHCTIDELFFERDEEISKLFQSLFRDGVSQNAEKIQKNSKVLS